MATKTKVSSVGIEIQARLINGTYVDLWRAKDYLSASLFDPDTLDQKIRSQAINATDRVNTFLGRTVAFTEEELMTTQFAGIVDSASQMASCFVQRNPQAAAMSITEDTLIDCAEALETLKNWAQNNGLTLPSEQKTPGHIMTELVYITNDPEKVI